MVSADAAAEEGQPLLPKSKPRPGPAPDPLRGLQLVRQRHGWDCGVAVVRMGLAFWGRGAEATESEVIGALHRLTGGTNSFWTIDIALCLARMGGDGCLVTLTTVNPGADADYAEMPVRGVGGARLARSADACPPPHGSSTARRFPPTRVAWSGCLQWPRPRGCGWRRGTCRLTG